MRYAPLLLLLSGLSACLSPRLEYIEIREPRVSLPQGKDTQLIAIAWYSNSTQLDVSNEVHWQSDSESIAPCSASGVVRGERVGSTSVTATFEGVSALVPVAVTSPEIVAINLFASYPTRVEGLRFDLFAIGRFSNGSQHSVTESATWSTSDPEVAAIGRVDDTSAEVWAGKPGHAQVTATLDGVSASLELSVVPRRPVSLMIERPAESMAAGTEMTVHSIGVYPRGVMRDLTEWTQWVTSTDDVSVALDGETAIVRATKPGPVTLTAAYDGVAVASDFDVIPGCADVSSLER